MVSIVCFVGHSGVGKTTLLEKVIVNLRGRGLQVAAIKHAPHGFEMDEPGKDSWRLTRAGCNAVILSSPQKMALIEQQQPEPTLDELASMLQDKVDIILAEGYKNSDKPKIEVFRSGISERLICSPQELLAIVSDQPILLDVPQFRFTEVDRIADLIVSTVYLHQSLIQPLSILSGKA